MRVAEEASGLLGIDEMIGSDDSEEVRRAAIEARLDAKEMEILSDGRS